MNDSRGDTRRALIECNEGNPCYLDGYTNPIYRDSVETLSESMICFQMLTVPVTSCLEYPGMDESSRYQRNWTSSTMCYMQ
ncbi:hypothetical protein TNCV_2913391 [Trichonephila clavipes]|nr:hypothetical protein TNCV_2913391 [Trichonephila clavipes]